MTPGVPAAQPDSEPPQPSLPRDRRGWVLLIPLAIALLCAGLSVASGAYGVLTAMLFPPMPRLPAGAQAVWHTSEAWGADRWNFQLAGEPCSAVAQIEALDGVCTVVPGQCGRSEPVPDSFYDGVNTAMTARCTGSANFSIFSQRWNTVVSPGGIAGETRLEVERQVRWGG